MSISQDQQTVINMLTVHSDVEVALHIRPPEPNDSHEPGYGGYKRVSVGEWGVEGDRIYNKNDIIFPECYSGWSSISYFSVVCNDNVLFSGPLNRIQDVCAGVTVILRARSLVGCL